MIWYIIGRDMHVLCTASTDLLKSLPIDDSSGGQTIAITNDCAIGTYDFTVDPRHPDAVYVTEGNYIAFRDKYGKDRLYTIMAVEGDDSWDVHCEDIGIDLINETAVPWDYTGNPKTIADTLAPVLLDSGWEIGVNEVASYKRATKFEGTTDSQLTRIGDVCNQFDAECEFAIEMKGAKVTKQVINIYKTLGQDMTQQRFLDGINLISLSKSGSIEDLITCVRCYGKEVDGVRTDIASIEYDDGDFYTPKGDVRIYSREARKKWSRFRAWNYEGQGEYDGYINGTFEYDTDSPQELFNRGLAELKDRCDKKVSYEANLYDLRADIGDTIQIADNRFAEKVYLSARIQSVTNHYSVKGQDTGVLANYKILTANPTDDISKIMEQLKGQIVSVKGSIVSYQVGDSGTEPPTGEWSLDVPELPAGKFLWTRTETTYSDGSKTTAYSVSQRGEDGKDGEDGNGISNVVNYYLATSAGSGVTVDTSGWTTTPQTITEQKKYLWNYEETLYTDGQKKQTEPHIIGTYGEQGPPGEGLPGADGVSYTIEPSVSEIRRSADGYSPDTLKFAVYRSVGGAAREEFPCYADFQKLSGSEWTSFYKYTGEPIHEFTILLNTMMTGQADFVKMVAYSDAGFVNQIGECILPVAYNSMETPGTYSSATPPSNPFVGMLWRNTGTSGGYVQNAIYQWDGSEWQMYYFSARNIEAETLSAITAVLGEVISGKITNKVDSKKAIEILENQIDFYDYTNETETFAGSLRGSHIGGLSSRTALQLVLAYAFHIVDSHGAEIMNIYSDGVDINKTLYYNGRNMERVFDNLPDDTKLQISNLNDAISYSGEEEMTNKRWFGSYIYKKTINVGEISGADKTINHEIQDVNVIWVDPAGSFLMASNGMIAPFPRVAKLINEQVSWILTKTQLTVQAGSNANFTACYVTLLYTKTTNPQTQEGANETNTEI